MMRSTGWAWLFLALGPACDLSDTEVRESPLERVTIVDLDGKHWDVTQAVARYGFDPARFRFGLGARAVVPLVVPPVAAPADSGYPAPGDAFDVIGTWRSAEARAYRLDDLVGVEVVDDVLGDDAVAVVHRPLLHEPSIHTRVVGGRVLTLSASGWLYQEQSVLFDYETESLWYRLTGETRLTCIAGPLFQATLPTRAFVVQPWSEWRASHPATGFMRRP